MSLQGTENVIIKGESDATFEFMQIVPPAGKVGDMLAKVIEDPNKLAIDGLRDFKAYAEDMPDRIRMYKENKNKRSK
jgi:hypothetical protein